MPSGMPGFEPVALQNRKMSKKEKKIEVKMKIRENAFHLITIISTIYFNPFN